MNYIVFDLEWNQCPKGKARENPRMPFEIIEIGAIKLDENRKEIGRFSEMVRPLVYPTLHYRTKEITSLDQNQLRRSRTFCPVVRDFLKWCGDDCKFVTWGNLDLTELQQNMDYYRLANPFPKPLFYPMLLYLLINGTMNCFALFRLISLPCIATVITCIGAFLFFISDSTLFFVRFKKDGRIKTHFWVMLTYSIGELLIIIGLL